MKKIKFGLRDDIKIVHYISFVIATLLYIAFTIWTGNYLLLIGFPIVVDIYLTRILPWGFWKKIKNPHIRKIFEWGDAILYALLAVYMINNFLFQNYKIPTSSLEKSLLVGDYLYVSKVSYGPRVPMTPLSFPLAQHTLPIVNTKSYIETPQLDYKRLKGFGTIERNDIVVFNFPAGDTVTQLVSNPDYYTLVKDRGAETIKRNPKVFGEVIYRPVDRRENYVKRCVALPGDIFEIRNNQIYIDSVAAYNPINLQQNYLVMLNGKQGRITQSQFEDLGVSVADRTILPNNRSYNELIAYLGFPQNQNGGYNAVYHIPLTEKALETLKSMQITEKIIVEPANIFGGDVYPLGAYNNWTRSDFGPLWIPQKGETLQLTVDNLPLYSRVIKNYEGNELQLVDSTIYINGKAADSYTFKMDYYFMLGDNRDNSADSRYWGFVPEDHIVGEPKFVWLSINEDKGWFNGRIRFNRLFRSVNELAK